MNTPLLIICGPTATGKTDLAISLAQKFKGEIVSADSRQVYKGMTIGTGKQYSEIIKIWGYDLVDPNEEFSLGHFLKFANEKIIEISVRGNLPILVGGTGLYIKGILENFETASIPPNQQLRTELENTTVAALYQKLRELDNAKALSLNESDRQNPRRLIRAIEITVSKENTNLFKEKYNSLLIGLRSDIGFLEKRVDESVKRRLKNGVFAEVKDLLLNKTSVNHMSMSATGYKEICSYLNGEISETEAIKKWKLSERQYVKRQLTWFQKQNDIHWFDIQNSSYKSEVEDLVEKWHNKQCQEKSRFPIKQ